MYECYNCKKIESDTRLVFHIEVAETVNDEVETESVTLCRACGYERGYRHYMNVYRVKRFYGGPEEGGWWYNAGKPLASVPLESTDDVEAIRERLLKQFIPLKYGNIYSVLGGQDIEVQIEDKFAEAFPAQRPHYE